jgi:hypothetical protein
MHVRAQELARAGSRHSVNISATKKVADGGHKAKLSFQIYPLEIAQRRK